MLSLPPLTGLQATIKYLLPYIAELTGSKKVLIRLDQNDKTVIGYRAGKFFESDGSQNKDGSTVYILLKTGWLELYKPDKEFEQYNLSHYCSQLIENSKTYEILQHQSMIDTLTGLPNRGALDRKIIEEINRVREFCVIFIDVDNFKKINDTYGHLMGDNVLKSVGASVRKVLRSSDFLARYGGDEFISILPETNDLNGSLTASRLRNYSFRVENFKVGISVGMSIYPEDGDTPEQLIKKADSNMYADKELKGAK